MNWLDLSRPWPKGALSNLGQTHLDIGYKDNHPKLGSLMMPGRVFDVRTPAAAGHVGLEDVDLDACAFSPGSEGVAVIFDTGWEKFYGSPEYDRCPDIDYDLVDALIDRGAKLLMVDSPGLYGGARSPSHSKMDLHIVDRGSIAVENLCNVDRLPDTFTLYCFPLNVLDQNWLPARIVASWSSG
jgi:kynurenine formamidase